MAIACFLERLRVRGNVQKVKRTHVYAEGWGPSPFRQYYERLRNESAWSVLTTKTGHHMMLDDPEGCAQLLPEAAK